MTDLTETERGELKIEMDYYQLVTEEEETITPPANVIKWIPSGVNQNGINISKEGIITSTAQSFAGVRTDVPIKRMKVKVIKYSLTIGITLTQKQNALAYAHESWFYDFCNIGSPGKQMQMILANVGTVLEFVVDSSTKTCRFLVNEKLVYQFDNLPDRPLYGYLRLVPDSVIEVIAVE